MAKRRVLTGNDTHIINGRILKDFVNGDCVIHEFSEDLSSMVKGKNGNTIITYHPQGEIDKSTYKVMRGSDDHKFLLGIISEFRANPAGFALMTGESIKNIGDGSQNVAADTLILGAGIPKKLQNMKDNADGDATQAIVEIEITWGEITETIS